MHRRIQANFDRFHAEHPDFAGIHIISADTVEECWQLLRQSLTSVSYESLGRVRGYGQWLAQQDWTAAYARHRRNLQLIGSNNPGRRWILKNPSHLFALDALMAAYPDASVVQTHRDLRAVIASSCSLSAQATARAVGGVRRRADRPLPARPVGPVATALGVYERFGLSPTAEARAALAVADEQSRTAERRPAHAYSLADFGLTEAEVDERFAGCAAQYAR